MIRSINEIISQRLKVRISQKDIFLQTDIDLNHIKYKYRNTYAYLLKMQLTNAFIPQ